MLANIFRNVQGRNGAEPGNDREVRIEDFRGRVGQDEEGGNVERRSGSDHRPGEHFKVKSCDV